MVLNSHAIRNSLKTLIFFLVLAFHTAFAQESDWDALLQGEYSVGYRSEWVKDFSRSVIFEDDTMVRPVLVNMWYPAEKKSLPGKMAHGDYFNIRPENSDQEAVNTAYKTYNLEVLAYQLLGKELHEFDKTDQEVFDAFLKQPGFVQRDALPEQKQFPLVIYHQGFGASFEDNAMLAQFLARNGYIVIGSSFFSENLKDMGVDGRAESVKDIAFLINYASSLSNVDVSKVALVGHSGGAQAVLLAKSSGINSIKSVVAIETTQEIFGISDTRWKDFSEPLLENQKYFNASLLAMTTHLGVFQLYDSLVSSDRYYLTFPESLNHDEFISQGIVAGQLRQKTKQDNSSYQPQDLVNYTKVNRYILAFLNWQLKDQRAGNDLFKEDKYALNTGFDNSFITHLQKGMKSVKPYSFNPSSPISPKQVWQLARTGDSNSLISSLEYFLPTAKKNPVFSDLFAFALISELLEEGRLDIAKKLFLFYRSNQIPVSQRFLSLSKFSVLMGKKDYARRCLSHLLELEPDNTTAQKLLYDFSN